jgi:hypothetical protein
MKRTSIFVLLALAAITVLFLRCDDDYLSGATTNDIRIFIRDKYPNARIVEIERENNRWIEVTIIHDNVSKEVIFDRNVNWRQTSWDVSIFGLPQAVRDIVNDPAYGGYRIDDADFVETAHGNYYLLELEKGNSERWVKIDEAGRVLN